MKLFLATIVSVCSLLLRAYLITRYYGFIQDEPTKPTREATIPPRAIGVSAAAEMGRERTAYEVPSAPRMESPVVLYTFCMNRLSPTFWEMY